MLPPTLCDPDDTVRDPPLKLVESSVTRAPTSTTVAALVSVTQRPEPRVSSYVRGSPVIGS